MPLANVAVCCDLNMKIGLHVTLLTCLNNLHPGWHMNIYFFHEGFTTEEINKLNSTLSPFKDRYELIEVSLDISKFTNYKSLHGNYFTYARLLIADQLPQLDKILYLDSDLFVNTDISKLYKTDMEDYCIGAVSGCTMQYAIENKFFKAIGYDLNAPYFNAGVLLINLKKWRNENTYQICLDFLEKYSQFCTSADQAVLNGIFYNNFLLLPSEYNIPIYANDKNEYTASDGILHLVGSPKPWDLFGEVFSIHSKLFYSYLDKTYYKSWHSWKNVSVTSVLRMTLLTRSYYKSMKNILK